MDFELKQCHLEVAKVFAGEGIGDVMVAYSKSLKNGRKVFVVQKIFG